MRKRFARLAVACALLLLWNGAASAQAVDLVWMTPGSAQEQAAYRQVADRFEELNPGVTVHLVGHDHEEMVVSIVAGSPPDIAFSTIQEGAGLIRAGLIRGGLLQPLDAWIERDGFDIDDFFPSLLAPYRFDGESFGKGPLYGIPKESAVRGMFYNASAFDEAGLPQPTAYAEQGVWNWALRTARGGWPI